MATRETSETLIERSSLGEPAVKRLRASAPTQAVADVLRRHLQQQDRLTPPTTEQGTDR